jgi:hypothetical protein
LNTHRLPQEAASGEVDMPVDHELVCFVTFGIRPDPSPERWLRILVDAGELALAEELRREMRP